MAEQFDFPRELRCDGVMLAKSHPYTADMLNRAAAEIERLREEVVHFRAATLAAMTPHRAVPQ